MADSGGERFKKLDNKLAAVIHRAYREEESALTLMQDIQILDEEISKNGGMMRGRQIARLILEYFTTDRHLDQMWQLDDLFSLMYPGDKAMGAFRFIWHKIVSCL